MWATENWIEKIGREWGGGGQKLDETTWTGIWAWLIKARSDCPEFRSPRKHPKICDTQISVIKLLRQILIKLFVCEPGRLSSYWAIGPFGYWAIGQLGYEATGNGSY